MGKVFVVIIQKKGGETENFERKKAHLSLIRAGTPPDQAERIVDDIETWLSSQSTEIVSSSEIRQRIIDVLKKINPQAARGYKIHRQSKGPR